jgi:uncharacterized protein DUF6183
VSDLQTLVDGADSTELLIAVDRLVAGRDWDGLVDLARRCLEAVEYGRQLWPVAMHIDYRLALEGPAAYAGAVLRPGVARFALGPLTEVAASTHDWASLAPYVADPASATAVTQERVLRGEDLRGRGRGDDGLPLTLAGWEPAYALPRYRDRSAAFPQPDAALRLLPGPGPRTVAPAQPLNSDDAVQALRDLVETWTAQSSGTVNAMVVEGDADAAVGTLLADRGARPAAGMLPIELGDAMALMQWTGASGGAYGRRPGGARGRFAAWWAATAVAGLTWPPDPADLGHTLGELRWFRWSPPEAETGWVLRLAVADPVDGLAWAVEATDHREDEEEEP